MSFPPFIQWRNIQLMICSVRQHFTWWIDTIVNTFQKLQAVPFPHKQHESEAHKVENTLNLNETLSCCGSWHKFLCKTSEDGGIAELAVLIRIIFEVLEPGAATTTSGEWAFIALRCIFQWQRININYHTFLRLLPTAARMVGLTASCSATGYPGW